MANLRVRMKDGSERDMTQKVYDLIGFKRKPTIIGKSEQVKEMSEMDKLKAELIRKKAAGEPLQITPPPIEEFVELAKEQKDVVVTEKPKAKPGPKPKSKE